MKFENKDFRWVEAFAQSIEMMRKIMSESLDDSIAIRFLIDRSKKAFDWLKGTLDWSKLEKIEFSAKNFGNCFESLKKSHALWTVLWNILTLYTYFLIKYNSMDINRGLCSLEK